MRSISTNTIITIFSLQEIILMKVSIRHYIIDNHSFQTTIHFTTFHPGFAGIWMLSAVSPLRIHDSIQV